MDTSHKNSGRHSSAKLKDGPPGPVPFQGIGTRLRRSRSKDHSNEFDNLSTTAPIEISNLRHHSVSRNNAYEHSFGYLAKGGTLERPKRLYSFSNVSESSNFIQQPLYGTRNLYEESRLLGHQYEEPHLVMDRDPLYDTNPLYGRRRSKDSYLVNGGGKHFSSGRVPPLPTDHPGDIGSTYHSYMALDGPDRLTLSRPNTTVIPPSKLFAKSLSTSYNAQSTNSRHDSKETTGGLGTLEYSPKSQNSSSLSSSNNKQQQPHTINRPKELGGNESDSSTTKADSGLLLTRTSHELSTSSSSSDHHHGSGLRGENSHHNGTLSIDRTFNDQDTDPAVDSPPKLCLTSSSQSSVMHTYANPFQNGGCGGSTFSEDTTGPIIPDMNTLRPSQLLKNSFSGSGPPPNLHHAASTSANRRPNVISYLSNRLWSAFGGAEVHGHHDQKSADLAKHRCSWRRSTISLLVLVLVLFIVIIFLSALSSSTTPNQSASVSSKVPCIVVEDLDSTSSSHLSSSSSSSNFDRSDYLPSEHHILPDHMPTTCPLTLPRDPLHFKEVHLPESSSGQTPFSFRLAPFTAWTVWFGVVESSYVNFQFYAPLHARLVLLAAKNEPPSLAVHQIFQVISDEALSANNDRLSRRSIRESQLLQLQSKHYFEQGSWYLTLVNDLDHILPLVVNLSTIQNLSSQCSNNCHNHGHCHLGKCQCFPGFLGHDCADNVCPVFCGGHGQYLQGSCRCEAGWKGRECSIRVDECEVADCNRNGVCIDGLCQCRNGFKGEHCELADCLDPQCFDHGVCFEGVCICKAGWSGTNCSLPDSKLHQFFPNCSRNGVYDFESGQCVCYSHYSGFDCSKLRCNLDCGPHGYCQDGRCQCSDGWSGPHCNQRQCDSRCLEHGKCENGTCICADGWMGKYCTLDGCPNLCSKHGRCVSSSSKQHNLSFSHSLGNGPLWSCRCDDGWGGRDCSAPQETNCSDEIDNDNDGLVDCADSECCRHEQCGHQSLMCITSPDPLDILLRKQPPSPISSFFQKVHFLIEDGSVQSYAQKDAYSEKRVSVIRGQVVSKEFNGLIGVRVSVATDPQFGFTLTRSDGWFDILVNGGGIVTLQFQRNPFYPIKKSVYVAWNDIGVIQNPIVMYSVPDNSAGADILSFNNRASSFSVYSQFLLPGFDLGDNWSINKQSNVNTSDNCAKHDYEQMKPSIRNSLAGDNLWLTKNTGVMCGNDESCILAESQTVHEKVPIGTSQINLVYQSSLAQGYLSTLYIQLTLSSIPAALRFVLVRIVIEGNVHEKIFEADPELSYTYAWNKRNVYKQKVYGFAAANVYVGYIYHGCPSVIWNALHAKLRGYDMEISELGGWNLDIHHRYNLYDGLFQRGDGQIVYFHEDGQGSGQGHTPLSIESIAGSHMQPRPLVCTNNAECGTTLSTARFFALTSLTASPDGSIYVGDANLIRRITPDGRVQSVYAFKYGGHSSGASSASRQTYEYYVAFNSADNYLYIADPDRLQIVRVQITEKQNDAQLDGTAALPDIEVVIGTGERCLPHDRNQCGDGKTGLEVQLVYPKGLAFGLDGSLFFADGSVVRVMDTSGFVHRIVGDWSKRQWKPSSCQTTRPASEMKLHWPTSLAVNPADGTLYFVDNFVIFKLNHEMHVSIVAGLPSFCLEETVSGNTQRPTSGDLNCQSQRLDSRLFSYCGEDILFGSLTFTSNGVLFASDISRQSENRIFTLNSDGWLTHVAGFKSSSLGQQQHGVVSNCSVERCSDIGGHNCTCLISDSDISNAEPISPLMERTLGVNAKLFSISALTATGDGTVYMADEGSLRLYRLKTFVPQTSLDEMEIKIISPNRGEIYNFNRHGQHVSTRSTISGRTIFTFHYSQDNSFAKLIDVVDVAGNKLSFMRDPSGALHTIESSSGFKAFTLVNKFGFLEQITTHFNGSLIFDYYANGLIRSKLDSSTGATHYYLYNADGRISGYVSPSGAFTSLHLAYGSLDQILSATEISPFAEEPRQFQLSISPSSQLRLNQRGQSIDLNVLSDGSLLMNSSRNVNALFSGKSSQLSQAMLPMQAQMFPLISRCRIELNLGRGEGSSSQSLDLSVEYGLKMKSSIITAVEKFIAVNSSLALKMEYDWKANREIYYNQSQRPILYLQFDENGRPIQWVPNIRGPWLAHSLSYDKAGHLSSWQDGAHMFGYIRDRAGRLIEVRQSDHFIRYTYGSDVEHGHSLQLPSSITLRSGHKYLFELDDSGRLRGIVTPKGTKHEFDIKIIFGFYRFAYCPPIIESKPLLHSTSNCYLIYFNEARKPVMKVLPYDHGKIVYRYASRVSLSKDFFKDLHRSEGQVVDQVIFGNGLVERWYDRKSGNDLKGIWRSGAFEFAVILKYTRNSGQLKHQSYQFGNIASVSQLTYNYRYDDMMRLRAIQCKLGSISLPTQEFSYSGEGKVEMMGNFRYFERSTNETLIGDGVALFVRRYETTRGKIRHASVTIADKEVFRVDYMYDSMGMLVQTRTFMRHLGANKMRMQNFTYDSDGQLVEVQGREHWRFVYDFNGNLVTFLYLGNRIDIDYDSADRVRNFGKGQEHGGSSQAGSSPYVTDLRGFVVQRGDEVLSYNILGQLLSASRPNRYEVNYIYDYRNRLVVRRDNQNNVTQYFYGNLRKPNLVTHAFNNADGRVLSFVYDDHDDSLMMLRVNNENFYVACDQTQSPLLVLDHRGQVIKEIHRSPYGHILFDSNPTFYLPVDFQGGIPDPLTNLVHFPSGRVYDTLAGRWMTPKVESLLQRNLIESPRLIHLYQFNLNDPINRNDPSTDDILSSSQFTEQLRSSTSALIEADLNHSQLRLLSQLEPSLSSALNYHSPVRSHFFTSLAFIIDELRQFASFKTRYFSKLTQQDWTSAPSMWQLISMDNAMFGDAGGVLVSKWPPSNADGVGHQERLQVLTHSRVNSALVEFLNKVVNGSTLVDAHLVMGGQDHFYLVHEQLLDSHSLSQLNKYQYVTNYTVQTGQNEMDKKPVIDIRITLDTIVMNIRFGTTSSKERERVLRLAKKYSTLQRLFQERMAILQSRSISPLQQSSWSEEEKQFILSADRHQQNNGPFKAEYYHSAAACSQLADDASNIVLKSKRSHS